MSKTVQAELETIHRQSNDGMLHAEAVVSWAQSHKRSALHKQFEWDDSKAAHEHRLWQARRIIQLNVVAEDRTPKLINLRIDRAKGGGYRSIHDVLDSKALRGQMLSDCIADLERVQARYSFIKDLISGVVRETGKLKRVAARLKKNKGSRKAA